MPVKRNHLKVDVVSSIGNDPSKIENLPCCFCEGTKRDAQGNTCDYCHGTGQVYIELLEIPCSCGGTGVQQVRRKL